MKPISIAVAQAVFKPRPLSCRIGIFQKLKTNKHQVDEHENTTEAQRNGALRVPSNSRLALLKQIATLNGEVQSSLPNTQIWYKSD